MAISEDDKRVLLGLIWALKKSDLSTLTAILQDPQDAGIITVEGSGNDIFYSTLQKWGFSRDRGDPTEHFSPDLKAQIQKNPNPSL